MSMIEAAVHKIDSGETFEVRGQKFVLALADAVYAFRDIHTEMQEGSTHRDYLMRVREWVEQQVQVTLTLDETDSLNDLVDTLWNRKKKLHKDAIETMWKSPSSTVSGR